MQRKDLHSIRGAERFSARQSDRIILNDGKAACGQPFFMNNIYHFYIKTWDIEVPQRQNDNIFMRKTSVLLIIIMLFLLSGCDFLLDTLIEDNPAAEEPGEPAPSPDSEDGNAYLGYPSSVDSENTQLINRAAYTLLYSYDDLIPLWVSWHLDQEERGTGRKEGFVGDSEIPPEYRVYSNDYEHSGFSRGHMCPNADRNGNTELRDQTFYMSNIIPQNQECNDGAWQAFEKHLQNLADNGREVYILAGPYGTGGYDEENARKEFISADINGTEKHINVPEAVWKIAVILNDDQDYAESDGDDIGRINDLECDVVAVFMPNSSAAADDYWEEFICSVNYIEAKTGFDFLSVLDSDSEAQIESAEFYDSDTVDSMINAA